MSNSRSSGLSFASVLFLVFLTLKLLGKIDWSWWWVTAPLWGGVALIMGFAVVVSLFVAVVTFAGRKR
jgi:hypothetical protein